MPDARFFRKPLEDEGKTTRRAALFFGSRPGLRCVIVECPSGPRRSYRLLPSKQNYVDAIRFARSGAVIVTFVDLPASYGGAVPTTLFGRPARLAMGIASLARVSGAVVVPMAVYSETDGDKVSFGRPFEVVDGGMAEKMRVADLIRRHIEVSLLRSPAQWHMWARLDEFIEDRAQDEAA